MRFPFSIIFILSTYAVKTQSCLARFSYDAQFEKVKFHNRSSVKNAHFFWNFGDGNGSNFKNPVHEFPENGTYLVSLYIHDTVTKCSSVFDAWIEVRCQSDRPCIPKIDDSVFYKGGKPYYKIIERSENCEHYRKSYNMLHGTGASWTVNEIPDYSSNTLTSINYGDSVSRRQVFKTFPFKYDRSKNYLDCSGNFEWRILEEDTGGQRILFSAMYKGAMSYRWAFSGFGDDIIRVQDTASIYFPYRVPRVKYPMWMSLVSLTVKDQNGHEYFFYQRLTYRPMGVTIEGADVKQNEVTVYPSYVKDKFYTEIDPALQVREISIVDATGRIVLNLSAESREADISGLVSGIYLVRFTSSQGIKVTKIIKD